MSAATMLASAASPLARARSNLTRALSDLTRAAAGRAWRPRLASWSGWLLLAAALLSAAGAGRAQQLPLRGYSQLDGLANLGVNALVQDGAGYLWVGTDNGLYRFDGSRWRRHPQDEEIRDVGIAALHVDPAGRLWVGTDRGLFRLRGTSLQEVRRVDGKALPVKPGQHLASLDAGRLLVQSNGRLHRVQSDGKDGWHAVQYFSPAQTAARPALNDVYGMLLEADGTLWLGCKFKLCRYRDGVLEVLDEDDGLPPRRWLGLLRDRAGALWLAANDKVVARAADAARFGDRGPRGLRAYEPGQMALLRQDGEGRLLYLSDNGLFRNDADGWRHYGEAQGLRVYAGNHSALLDRDGDLWIGVPGRGLVQWQGYRHWENWNRAQGMPDENVWSLLRTRDGAMRVGTGAGLASLRGGRLSGPARGGGESVSAMAEDGEGRLWRGDFSGTVTRHDRRGRRGTVVARLPDHVIYHMLFDADGKLWICTSGGLYVIADPDRPVAVAVGAARALLSPDAAFVDGCRDAAGRLWFVSAHGLLRLEHGRWSRPPMPRKDLVFSHVVCDGDALWLAESEKSRLWRADSAQPWPQAIAHPLLAGRLIMSMAVDRRGWLWLGTDNGLLVRNGTRWRLFNQQSGMVWNDTNQSALHVDHDDTVWVGTSNGLSHLLRPEALFAARAIPLHLGSARYNGAEFGAAPGGVKAPWSGGALDVRLAAPVFQNHEALSYRYRLLGQEEAWSRSDNGELRYAALAPGEYRLQVVAEHATSQASSAMLDVPLTITPPWWRTRWAYAGAALLALGLIGLLHRYRVGRVLRQRALLEQRVAERTAELEASREEHRLRSLKDGLTKAWNRSALMERLALLTAPGAAPFLLVLLDLDHFKKVNDTHGHLAGDEVLREMVRRIQAQLRASDTVGRYGGEEFMLLLPGLDLASGGRRLEQLHREVCAAPVDIDGFGPLPVTCSGGVVVGRAELPLTAEQWIALADQALYRAKALGRNRLEYAPEAGLA